MFTKSGKATVTVDYRLVPIAYDGPCASEPIAEATVEAALKSFEWKRGYLGFKFAEAVSVKVQPDDGSPEVSLSREKTLDTTYLFATKLVSLNDLKSLAEYKPAVPRDMVAVYEALTRDRVKHRDIDESNLVYETDTGAVRFLRKNTVLINKQGQQLWPLPKA